MGQRFFSNFLPLLRGIPEAADPLIVIKVIVFSAAIGGLLTVVGLGPAVLLGRKLRGAELLVAPFVGLGILYWGAQWLSPHFASGPIVIFLTVVFGVLTVAVTIVRRKQVLQSLRELRWDLAILLGFAVGNSIALQLPTIHQGIFSLSDFSGDDLFTWAPSAAYMQTHAYISGHLTAYTSPLLWVLPTNIYPGSAGSVDGGLLSVFGVHSWQLVEPFSAVCLILSASVVYMVLRWCCNTSRLIAAIGLVMVSTNQFRFFTSGFGLAQSTRGTALLMGILFVFVAALLRRSPGLAVLAGGMTAVVVGVYMPAFLVAASVVVGGLIAVLVPVFRKGWGAVPWSIALTFVGSGIIFGLQNLKWLLFDGGIHAWVLQTSYGPALFFLKYPFQYLAGSAPIQYLYRTGHVQPFDNVPPLFWDGVLSDLALIVGVLAVGLAAVGAVSMMRKKSLLVVALALLTPVVYGTAVFIDNKGGFGSVLSVDYLVPFVCILAAFGFDRCFVALRTASLARHAAERTPFRTLGLASVSVILVVVVLFQIGSTAEDEHFYVSQSGMLSKTNLRLSMIATVIPKGSTVLMYATDGSNGDTTVAKTQALVAAANFLPDRQLTVDGHYFAGTYGGSDSPQIRVALADHYDFILHVSDPSISDPPVPAAYHQVWQFRPDHLVLYALNSASQVSTS